MDESVSKVESTQNPSENQDRTPYAEEERGRYPGLASWQPKLGVT